MLPSTDTDENVVNYFRSVVTKLFLDLTFYRGFLLISKSLSNIGISRRLSGQLNISFKSNHVYVYKAYMLSMDKFDVNVVV